MNGLRETCHCGHDKATHYLDREASPATYFSCLAMHCDCRRYAYEGDPKPLAQVVRPSHVPWCRCFACKEWIKASGGDPDQEHIRQTPITPLLPGAWP